MYFSSTNQYSSFYPKPISISHIPYFKLFFIVFFHIKQKPRQASQGKDYAQSLIGMILFVPNLPVIILGVNLWKTCGFSNLRVFFISCIGLCPGRLRGHTPGPNFYRLLYYDFFFLRRRAFLDLARRLFSLRISY